MKEERSIDVGFFQNRYCSGRTTGHQLSSEKDVENELELELDI